MYTPNDKRYADLMDTLTDASVGVADLIARQESGVGELTILTDARDRIAKAIEQVDGARQANRYVWGDEVNAALRRVEKGETTADDAAILRRAIK